MADSFQKKEDYKKNIARKKLKASKKEERKTNNNKGKGFESMIAYVDANGNLTSTPPENRIIQKGTITKSEVQYR